MQGAFVDQHFDNDLNFHATEEDPVTKKVFCMRRSHTDLFVTFVPCGGPVSN